MIEIIKILMQAMNDIHDIIIHKAHRFGYSDKQLHAIIKGV
ncbi:hypothetical protein [Clostridium thermarum]|nr:hypothetical protein [Clostridium thermarum]